MTKILVNLNLLVNTAIKQLQLTYQLNSCLIFKYFKSLYLHQLC